MHQKKIQIAIVGAGVIGLYLAWRLRQKGYKVKIFEREKEIKDKVCSGLVSKRIENFIPLDNSIIENEIDECLIHFPRKTITLKLKPTHYILNRQKLNLFLFSLVQKAGIEVLFNQNINEIPSGFNKIIACDGALSKIREKLSLPTPNFRLGVQFFVPLTGSSNLSSQVEVWPLSGGFFWKIPRESKIEYGAIGQVTSIKDDFKKFLKKNEVALEGPIRAALIPQGLVLPQSKNITLCGDAMGLTKPWSGGGIIWSLKAVEILVKNFPNFQNYHREIKREFEFKIFKGKLATSFVYFLGINFPYLLPSKISRDNDFPFF
ncbi:NAD-binding protein [bacterium]|nr:NAD-binding protein [bacterium]